MSAHDLWVNVQTAALLRQRGLSGVECAALLERVSGAAVHAPPGERSPQAHGAMDNAWRTLLQRGDAVVPHAWQDLAQAAAWLRRGEQAEADALRVWRWAAMCLVVASPAVMLGCLALEGLYERLGMQPALTSLVLGTLTWMAGAMLPMGLLLLATQRHVPSVMQRLGLTRRTAQALRTFAALVAAGVEERDAIPTTKPGDGGPWFHADTFELTPTQRHLAAVLTPLHGASYAAHLLAQEQERESQWRMTVCSGLLRFSGLTLGVILLFHVVLPLALPVFGLAGSIGGGK